MKVALITGAGKENGIGNAVARELSKNGFATCLHYKSSKESAIALSLELVNSIAVYADLTKSADIATMKCEIEKTFSPDISPVCVLVNNAGISWEGLFCDMTDDDFDRLYNADLKSAFCVTKAFLPNMIKNHYGKIVNISSMWGITGASCEVCYSAMKAGIIGFTKALAKEVAPSNINVNCVAPGVIMTDMMKSFSKDDIAALKDETPINRLGTPQDIATAVDFLVNDKASFITGQVLNSNGGFFI